jgi:integrase/recombinase XerD
MDPLAVTPHVLRHTCATEMLRRGVNLRIIQQALGHAWVSTTQLYTHVVDEDVRRAMTE